MLRFSSIRKLKALKLPAEDHPLDISGWNKILLCKR